MTAALTVWLSARSGLRLPAPERGAVVIREVRWDDDFWGPVGTQGSAMARMRVDGDDLVLHLRWWEKAAARRGDVRVPLGAVRRVTVEPDWWRALRGEARRGLWIPGTLCTGTRGHHGGQDFVVVRPGGPVVCVALRPTAPFSLLAVSVPDAAEATARRLRLLAPRIDSSTCARDAIPVPEET